MTDWPTTAPGEGEPQFDNDDPARWDGAAILEDVESAFRRFTILPTPATYPAIALYVAYTHAAGVFQYAPRLLVTSAEKRSGKSRVLDIVTALAFDPLVAANATVAAIFRSLGDRPRTVVFDEADTIFGTQIKAEQNEDLRGLINAGFMRGTPVLRTTGPTHAPTEFDVFAPVVMAAIGALPDTITDRAVNIRMKRRRATETVRPYRLRRDRPALHDLRDRLSEWVSSVTAQLEDAYPETPLEDRAADLWEPLIAVADAAGGRWPAAARAAAVELTKSAAEADTESSPGLELLHDLRVLLDLHRSDFLPSKQLAQGLESLEDSRWRETGMSARRLSDMLKPYGVRPRQDPSRTVRGYARITLQDTFDRYLAAPVSEPSEPSRSAPASGTRPDTSPPPDTSNRPDDSNRPPENRVTTPIGTHRTGRTHPPTGHDHDADPEGETVAHTERERPEPPTPAPAPATHPCGVCGQNMLHPASRERGYCAKCSKTLAPGTKPLPGSAELRSIA